MIKCNLLLMIIFVVFVLGYFYCLIQFFGFVLMWVICNILMDNVFFGIIVVGMIFVIFFGGIDLLVGLVIVFIGVFFVKVIGFWGILLLVVFLLVLVMGCVFGVFMGLLIDVLKILVFIIIFVGMFFLCGVSYLVLEELILINYLVYDILFGLVWIIFGGGCFSVMGLLMLLVVVVGIFVVYCICFGNQVYVIGGNVMLVNLMGILICSVMICIYMFFIGLVMLVGIVFFIYIQVGYVLVGVGVELDVIVLVVIGGMLFSGGVGIVLGMLFGVVIQGLIQIYINFDGIFSLWWMKIVIGILLFIFIVLQCGLIVLWENWQNVVVMWVSGVGSC